MQTFYQHIVLESNKFIFCDPWFYRSTKKLKLYKIVKNIIKKKFIFKAFVFRRIKFFYKLITDRKTNKIARNSYIFL